MSNSVREDLPQSTDMTNGVNEDSQHGIVSSSTPIYHSRPNLNSGRVTISNGDMSMVTEIYSNKDMSNGARIDLY